MYGIEVKFNEMRSILNFISMYQLIQKLIGGERQKTQHRQDGDIIIVLCSFRNESRLKHIGILCSKKISTNNGQKANRCLHVLGISAADMKIRIHYMLYVQHVRCQ